MAKLGHTRIQGHLTAEQELRLGAISGDGIKDRQCLLLLMKELVMDLMQIQ